MMKNRALITLLGIFLVSFSSHAIVHQSFKIEEQTGSFTVRFSAVPSENGIDAALGFSPVEVSEWSDFNCIVLFSPEGVLKVRNGSAYDFDVAVNYRKGERYWIQMDVDIASKTYTVKVTPPGEQELILAQDYAFRENNFTGALGYFATKVQSSDPNHFVGTSNFQIGSEDDIKSHDNFNIHLDGQTGNFFVKLVATPSHDSLHIAFGLSSRIVEDWGDFNCIVGFTSNGNFTARNGANYESVENITYEAGMPYLFFFEGNTITKKYSVEVATPEGIIGTIAKDYDFRLDNGDGESIEYLGIHAVIEGAMDGIPGSYLAMDGIETGALNYQGLNPVSNQQIPVQKGVFSHTLVVTPSVDSINAGLSLNQVEAIEWNEMNAIISFSRSGFVEVRNDGVYEADVEYPYKGGEAFHITFEVDLTSDLYDVIIRRSPHEEAVLLADDYLLRSTPVDSIAYISSKTMWDPDWNGRPGSFLRLSKVGITEPLLEKITFINTQPTIDEIPDLSLIAGEEVRVISLTNVTDGDQGLHAVQVSAESSDTLIATCEVENLGGNIWLIHVTPLAPSTATITVTAKDNGGTDHGGVDEKRVSFRVSVEAGVFVEENTGVGHIAIYPNPSSNNFTIDGLIGIERIALYNISGSKIREIDTHRAAQYNLHVAEFQAGIYFIEFYNQENQSVKVAKLIVR